MADIQGFIKAAKQQGISESAIEQVLSSKGYQMPKSVGGFVKNIGKSAVSTVGGIGSALINTINPDMEQNTIANLAKLGIDAVKIVNGDKSEENKMKQLIGFYADRYGGVDKIGNTIYNDPVGFLLDVSTVAGGAGALGKTGNVFSKISKATDPFAIAGKGLGKIAPKNVFKSIGSSVENVGENMAFSGLHDPKLQKNIRFYSKSTPLKFSDQYNLWSRTPEAAQSAIEGIDKLAASKIAGKNISTLDIVTDFDKAIAKLKESGNLSDNALSQIKILQDKKAAILQQIGKGKSYTPLNIEGKQAQLFKKQITSDIPKSTFNLGSAETARSEGLTATRNILKNRINALDPALKQLGLDESALIRMKELLQNEIARGQARNTVSLSDLATTGIGYSRGGIIPAAASLIGKKLVESPMGVKIASKTIAGAGKMIKNARLPNIKGAGTAYNIGKAGRILTPSMSSKSVPQAQSTYLKAKPQVSPYLKNTSIQTKSQFVPTVKIPKTINFSRKSTVKKGNFY